MDEESTVLKSLLVEIRTLIVFLVVVLTIFAIFDIFIIKVRRLFKSNRIVVEENKKAEEIVSSSWKYTSRLSPLLEEGSKGMERRVATFREVTGLDPNTISRFVDDLDNVLPPSRDDSHPSPFWLDGPRDITTLKHITQSCYADHHEESDYAMKQMLAILETLNPCEETIHFFEEACKAIEYRLPFKLIHHDDGTPDWKAIRVKLTSTLMNPNSEDPRTLSPTQMSAVFDALPFLFDTVVCHEQLHQYQGMLSMLVMMALTGNSMIRRQCISAVSILMERNLLSQEFMKDGVVPGLFFIYQSGVGTFQSNDLRMECVQALCQVISYDTIHDRRWLFDHFLPRFSQMLKDSTMHVRKSALHIFGNLGNMFGQKFTEVFLVPHLITLSCDMTWAVRKVACEIFIQVAECASHQVRVDILSPNFVRLLNDSNKWVSFIAYQKLGPFIALFANADVTGIELKNGQIFLRDTSEMSPPPSSDEDTLNKTEVTDKEEEETFGTLPPNTWLPEADYNDVFDIKLNEEKRKPAETTSAAVKTPKRGERVMDSVISGINKMFSPFERNSPKSNTPKEIEKISATFSSPSKRSPLSLHSAVSLMDKWSKRNNPNNPQRFPIFGSSNSSSTETPDSPGEEKTDETTSSGIAAKCSSTDDLTKLGLDDEDDASPADADSEASSSSISAETRTASPRGRRIAKNAWSKLDVRQKLFLRRLGALPPGGQKQRLLSPKSPTRSPTRLKKKKGLFFDFAAPNEIKGLATPPTTPSMNEEEQNDNELNTVERQQYMESATPKFNDDYDAENDSDEDNAGLDKSFALDEDEPDASEDTPLTIEIKSSHSESVSVAATSAASPPEPISNEFSLTYWSSNYALVSIDDELKPFGSSSSFTTSPTSNNYLESRFDVMKANSNSPRARSSSFAVNGSPVTVSPRRKANSTSESSPPTSSEKSSDSLCLLNTEEKEKLGILDIDDMEMSMSSNSSIHGEAAMTEDSDISLASFEHTVFEHVPAELVDSYMKIMGPVGQNGGSVATEDPSLCTEIYRHCAHNFPAVCYTLGRTAWPRLKLVFRKLAMDEQARVRQSISYSIHEIAQMLGTQITDDDLLPIFYELRNDQQQDVRNGILLHLYDFVRCLSIEKRDEMIFSLPQFFPIGAQPGNQTQNGDWRSRYELISQLSKLCSLYSIQDINLHMSGIALTLADDRVAEVRREAVVLVSTIVGALVTSEWKDIRDSRDVENGRVDMKDKKEKAQSFLSEQFVDDIVSSFAKTQKWTRRQTFCFICAQILRDRQCDGIQFRYFFATSLQNLVNDRVPNVRLASCEALSMWRKTLIAARAQEKRDQSPMSSPASEPSSIRRDINLVSDMMVRLANDSDIDAAYLAKKCQGLTDDQQPVDVEARTYRMREREELFFGDLILTDATGCVLRVVGKEVKQVIKAGPLATIETKAIQDVSEKEAPIEKFEEFEDETIETGCPTDIINPPEIQAVAVVLADSEDNREVVDMEVDEEEESPVTSAVPEVNETKEEEGDIPMDPSPSTPPRKTVESTSSPQNSDDGDQSEA